MDIYGYTKNDEQLLDLSEITFKADPSELRSLAKFILDCANEIENDTEGKWEHSHIEDRVTDWNPASPSIIIFNPVV